MYDNIEKPDKIIKTLFTSGYRERKFTQDSKSWLGGRIVKYQQVQSKYALYLLQSNWQEICGEHLAKNCCVHKLEGNELVIRTTNSMLANELFMMKDLFLQKINAYLAGKAIIKKLSFQAGGSIETYAKRVKEEAALAVAPVYDKICPKCGVIIQSQDELCDVCKRAAKNELSSKIYELLKLQPWLDYENCLTYYKCDKILFTAVKDRIKNFYFERVRLGHADDNEKYIAVMLLTGKQPAEIDTKAYQNALEYLRREQYVPTSGFRLHGKK